MVTTSQVKFHFNVEERGSPILKVNDQQSYQTPEKGNAVLLDTEPRKEPLQVPIRGPHFETWP